MRSLLLLLPLMAACASTPEPVPDPLLDRDGVPMEAPSSSSSRPPSYDEEVARLLREHAAEAQHWEPPPPPPPPPFASLAACPASVELTQQRPVRFEDAVVDDVVDVVAAVRG